MRENEIKAIFFDLDGTLFSHRTHRIPESTKTALRQLRGRGIHCVAATGRHLNELLQLLGDEIAFDGYITLNGQLCWDAERNCIFANPIPEPDKSRIVRMFKENELPTLMLEKKKIYLNYVNDHVVRVQEDISTAIPVLGTCTGDEFYQVIVYLEKGREDALIEELTCCRVVRWHDLAIDIIPNNGDKTVGVGAYLEANGIKRSEAMAFGDGGNDIGMLQYVGIGVAMGNAAEDVKRIADYVTDDVDDDGIEKALRLFGLIG